MLLSAHISDDLFNGAASMTTFLVYMILLPLENILYDRGINMVFFCDLDEQWIHRFVDLLKNHTDSTSAEIKTDRVSDALGCH